MTAWMVLAVLACAAVGVWLGQRIGGGGPGMIALIAITCAVLGSFAPVTLRWMAAQARDRQRPRP
jgi:hypothetical protein